MLHDLKYTANNNLVTYPKLLKDSLIEVIRLNDEKEEI
jgi:hypothetical protein